MNDPYSQLRKKVESGAGLSSPFHPYVGSAYCEGSSDSLMICGKATYGWGNNGLSGPVWEGNEDLAGGFVRDCVVGKGYNSAFWHFVAELGGRIQNRPDVHTRGSDDRRAVFDRLIWTNVAKIGATKGNLPESLLEAYAPVLRHMLLEELRTNEPKTLVFVTGWYGVDIWWDVLREWKGEDPETWLVDGANGVMERPASDDAPNVWVLRHPQGWTVRHRDDAVGAIAEGARARLVRNTKVLSSRQLG